MVPIAASHCRSSPTGAVGLGSKYWLYIQYLLVISQAGSIGNENPVGGQKSSSVRLKASPQEGEFLNQWSENDEQTTDST